VKQITLKFVKPPEKNKDYLVIPVEDIGYFPKEWWEWVERTATFTGGEIRKVIL
jgi:hypothetical protein